MPSDTLMQTVKAKATLVGAHAPDVIKTGVDTLRAAKDVVTGARDELKRTLKQGAQKIGEQLAHIATQTRKEAAETRKAEVKAKKRAKRGGTKIVAANPSVGAAHGRDRPTRKPPRRSGSATHRKSATHHATSTLQ